MIIAVVGPTASGKTSVSLELAELLGGPQKVEIISADAMQLYRGLDIGTAKLPVSQRRGIRHHQIDELDIAEEASVAAYQKHARQDLAAITKAGKIPLVVGGSGLYVSALLDELQFPGTDPGLRAAITEEARRDYPRLLRELEEHDPQAYATIDTRNERRVIRALEVIRLTGKPYTPRFPRHTSHYQDVNIFAIHRELADLHAAINERVDEMMREGLLEETAGLLPRGLREAPTASRATGYPQAMAILEGTLSLAEGTEEIRIATRKLARRQRSWFRADPRITWLDAGADTPAQLAARILTKLAR
ncbi:tRNA (adenosine(37)-N6)-dimethylallyltransferase MiaA [Actinotignum timonense]|uniref:tRNA dimethylallyltransferase n=1 Tax=Actinotignum timonense TaxID=1870995 RepID=A0ABU5GEQ1_9ACTO|nr:tRNA (adenosine(37)-N6)-dimethylallyltransferase MiaA [Actinotignum timonense]MDK6906568.1 tRNA (adenosine(37)-N6)-dimethylallyltransferase MiaA [Actinotignum timonense]MDK8782385.1 tRNA (adenosine(37)-N6)-dimethylallyltransferase MiaA [Actinotignum timonense]MDY5138070.1 tRNA (adenosine(37)-N6)-dimethylallyltransferase MiaA [Actinotignum timonense]MDY5145605.1 tRNA (adenosine(37)-N6)-dimethylallyltransferase MiaA [Actinotignum timonense]MDY5156636.1 tRNA (adenosine(37)-N6)-dimethylallyltra